MKRRTGGALDAPSAAPWLIGVRRSSEPRHRIEYIRLSRHHSPCSFGGFSWLTSSRSPKRGRKFVIFHGLSRASGVTHRPSVGLVAQPDLPAYRKVLVYHLPFACVEMGGPGPHRVFCLDPAGTAGAIHPQFAIRTLIPEEVVPE